MLFITLPITAQGNWHLPGLHSKLLYS